MPTWNIKKRTHGSGLLKLAHLVAFLLFLSTIFLPIFQGRVNALSAAQKKVYDSGVKYYDIEGGSSNSSCDLSGIGTISSTLPSNVPEPYRTIFAQAAAAYNTNVQLLAAIFLTENGNIWKPIDTEWSTSGQPPDAVWPDGKVGARGPFQFEPGTWEGYRVDGNNDGIKDPDNFYDAAYSAANLLSSYNARPNSPLGSLEQPLKTNTLLQIAASYNAGPGQVQIWGENAKLSDLFQETREYIQNVYSLITSGFTKSGKPGYPDPGGPGGGSASPGSGCSSGIVAGSIVKTALGLAWPSGQHGPNKEDATPEYQVALPKYNGNTGSGGGGGCGVFVATVMIASGADPSYPKRGTFIQGPYVRESGKYIIIESVQDTSH